MGLISLYAPLIDLIKRLFCPIFNRPITLLPSYFKYSLWLSLAKNLEAVVIVVPNPYAFELACPILSRISQRFFC